MFAPYSADTFAPTEVVYLDVDPAGITDGLRNEPVCRRRLRIDIPKRVQKRRLACIIETDQHELQSLFPQVRLRATAEACREALRDDNA